MSILLVHEAVEDRRLLASFLSQVGIRMGDCFETQVFSREVKDLKDLCGAKSDGIPGMPALVKGKFCDASFLPDLNRLYAMVNQVNPNIIIALGAASAWALLGQSGIKSVRGAFQAASHPSGTVFREALIRTYKVLPTYSPSAVRRDWTLRPIILSDLDKAQRNSSFPEIVRPRRDIWLEPTLADLAEYETRFIVHSPMLSIDIETKGDQITCIGFSPDPYNSIVIPFFAEGWPQNNYWPTLEDELTAWSFVRRWCKMKPSLFQNGLYDINRLWRGYGITCNLAEHDTMLLHHALQPEMEKGLGFMGTLYTEEASWKFMSRTETLKKED